MLTKEQITIYMLESDLGLHYFEDGICCKDNADYTQLAEDAIYDLDILEGSHNYNLCFELAVNVLNAFVESTIKL